MSHNLCLRLWIFLSGVPCEEYQCPWQVNLIGPAGCGGTLISPNVRHLMHINSPSTINVDLSSAEINLRKFLWVKTIKKIVTAAHCIHSEDPKSWKIRAGHLTRTDRQAQIRNVVRLYKHKKYNSQGSTDGFVRVPNFDRPVPMRGSLIIAVITIMILQWWLWIHRSISLGESDRLLYQEKIWK